MQNARLDEAQAGIKIARRSINNFRYVDDITLSAIRVVSSAYLRLLYFSGQSRLQLVIYPA